MLWACASAFRWIGLPTLAMPVDARLAMSDMPLESTPYNQCPSPKDILLAVAIFTLCFAARESCKALHSRLRTSLL